MNLIKALVLHPDLIGSAKRSGSCQRFVDWQVRPALLPCSANTKLKVDEALACRDCPILEEWVHIGGGQPNYLAKRTSGC